MQVIYWIAYFIATVKFNWTKGMRDGYTPRPIERKKV